MSSQKIIDTPENWDAASEGYATKVAPIMMESFANEFINRLDVNSNIEALEVAAGSGAMTETLARKVKSLLATDFSPKMLEFTTNRINNAGINNVTFRIMDGQNLDLEDASFDRAICSFGLMLFPDRHKGFTELYRVLRPGGRAVVSGWSDPTKFKGFALFMEALQTAFPDFPKPETTPPVFTLADLDSFKSQMEAGGFKDVEVEYVTKEMSVNGFDRVWEMFTVGAPPVQVLFNAVGGDGKERIHDALATIINDRYGSGPIIIDNAATVATGIV